MMVIMKNLTIGIALLAGLASIKAEAAITYVAASANGANDTSLQLFVNASGQANDLLIAQVSLRGGGCNAITSVPAGWTLVRCDASGTNLMQAMYWKVATAADIAQSFAWGFSATRRAAGGITIYRGVNTTAPIDTHSGQANASSTTATVPAVTTTLANDMLVAMIAADKALPPLIGTPGGMTQRYVIDSQGGNNGVSAEVADVVQAVAGYSGNKLATIITAQVSIGQMVALKAGVSASLHHLQIESPSPAAGITCTPTSLTVRACQDAACSVAYTGGVSGALTATGTPAVNWDGTTGGASGAGFVIANGSSTVTKKVQVATPGNVSFGIAATPSPAPSSAATCNFGSPSCNYSAADAGFLFDVPNHVSEVLQNVNISAVKKSDSSLACVPAFASVTKALTLTCGYSNPATGTLPVRVGGIAGALNVTKNPASACDAIGSAISLTFNASGIASTTVQYSDVGQMVLGARYAPTSGTEAGLVMTGSDNFIAAPASFAFSGVTASPIKAGENFTATVSAKNVAGNVTPNFGKETVAESVTLSLASRVAPSGANDCVNGPCTGMLAGNVTLPWAGGADGDGAATASNLTYSEVGQITLAATLASGSYLGSGLTATGTSAVVGNFVPAYFDTTVTKSCGSFTYSGQPFRVSVTARNVAGGLTVNYSNLSGCSVCSKDVTLYDPTAVPNFNSTNLISASDFSHGVGTRNTVAYTFPVKATAPATITVRAVDGSVTPNVTSNVSTVTYPTHVEGSTLIRSGRVRLLNAYGSELLDLPVNMHAEYWNGAAWAMNAADTCTGDTMLDANNAVTMTLSNITLDPAKTCVWDSAFPGLSGAGCATAAATSKRYLEGATPGVGFVGDFNLWLKAPGAGNSGTVGVTAAVPSWLRYNWTGTVANPSARATFGIYKSAPIIYMRENY